MLKRKLIAKKVEKIIGILEELQYGETELIINVQRNQELILQKINKLQEYNEIDDMVNSVFAKKLEEIEQKI